MSTAIAMPNVPTGLRTRQEEYGGFGTATPTLPVVADRRQRPPLSCEWPHRSSQRCTSYELGAWVAEQIRPDWFLTFTWADPEGTGTYTHRGVSFVEASLARWTKAFAPDAMWSGIESHRWRTTPHIHSIARGFDPAVVTASCACAAAPNRMHMPIWCATKTAFGRFQMAPVRSGVDAAIYVGKYINKGLGKIYVTGSGATTSGVALLEQPAPHPDEHLRWAEAVRSGARLDAIEQADDLARQIRGVDAVLAARQRGLRDRYHIRAR